MIAQTWSSPFIPLASLSRSVPILTLSGLSKRFLLPGWRFGWVALHDPLGVAGLIKEGLAVWANRYFGPSSLSQAALPEILATPAEWHAEVLAKIKVRSPPPDLFAIVGIADVSSSTQT